VLDVDEPRRERLSAAPRAADSPPDPELIET
jgi:hypothetical protein